MAVVDVGLVVDWLHSQFVQPCQKLLESGDVLLIGGT